MGDVVKFLIVGDWHSQLHEEPVFRAIKTLGHGVKKFAWHDYFSDGTRFGFLYKRAQNKFLAGPILSNLNRDMVRTVVEYKPDVIFVYRGTHITSNTLREIKRIQPSITLVGYNNDDPFSPLYPRWMWRHFIKSIPEYDLVFAYRKHNLDDFRKAGAKHVELLMPWFVPEVNRPIVLSDDDQEKYGCDVVFIGHYEDDGRLAYLEEIEKMGVMLRIYGHEYGWHKALLKSTLLRKHYPLRTVWGDEYNKALCASKVALCFLSKLNRDTYTRRCFEIPASGTLLLSEFSEDLASLFKEGEEADFFRSQKDLVEKLNMYLSDEKLRKRVAENGRRKVMASEHDVKSRMTYMISIINDIRDISNA